MSVQLLTEHHLEFLNITGGCTGWSESTLVKMPHCWKSYVTHGSYGDGSYGDGQKVDDGEQKDDQHKKVDG